MAKGFIGPLGAAGRWFDVPAANPAHPMTFAQADAQWRLMCRTPVQLPRPVLILGGYHGPSWVQEVIRQQLLMVTGGPPNRIVNLSYFWKTNIDQVVRHVLQRVEALWPSGDFGQTAPVDVVGVSMGGMVARAAAMGGVPGRPRLNVRRLLTLASPHRGARMAERIAIDAAAKDLRPGSAFVERLNAGLPTAEYQLVCYAKLRDAMVGARRTAPPDMEPIWVSGTRWLSHTAIGSDKRIIVDLARRLRGEEPPGRPSSPPSE